MKNNYRFILIVYLLIFILFIIFNTTFSLADVHYISECTNITQAGTYYLTRDIRESTKSYCINISANNVVLDCQGHKIDGNEYDAYYGIYVYRGSEETTNITIRNCKIGGWMGYDVGFINSNRNKLQNITFYGPLNMGINLIYSSYNVLTDLTFSDCMFGIVLDNSFNNILANIKERATRNRYLIKLYSSSNNELVNISLRPPHKKELIGTIWLISSDNNTLKNIEGENVGIDIGGNNNRLFNMLTIKNSKKGVSVAGNNTLLFNISIYGRGEKDMVALVLKGNNNIFKGGIIEKKWGTAIRLEGNNNTLMNVFLNKNREGLKLFYGANNKVSNLTIKNSDLAITLFNSSYNTLTDLKAIHNIKGVWFYYGSSFNVLSHSTFYSNNSIIIDSISGNNMIYDNLFNITNKKGIHVYYTLNTTKWNITKQSGTNIIGGSYLGGNYWAKPDGTGFSETCSDADGDGFCDEPYVLDENNIDYLPLTTSNICVPKTCEDYGVECGYVDDGCGNIINCGSCQPGQECNDTGQCVNIKDCLPEQTLFKISNQENAFAELWNETQYFIPICYSDIFGHEYTGSNPHECNNINIILRLNNKTNAYGQTVWYGNNNSDEKYPIDVCYGNLTCFDTLSQIEWCIEKWKNDELNDSEMLDCISDSYNCINYTSQEQYNKIVKLEKSTDATFYVVDSDKGNTTICCKPYTPPTPPVVITGVAYWANMLGKPGQRINVADVNDTVQLVWHISGHDNEYVNFTIYENTTGFLDRDCAAEWDDRYLTAKIENGVAIATWKAKVCDNDADVIYFTANLTNNPSVSNTSNTLAVNTEENDSPLHVEIIEPKESIYYYTNREINFTQNTYDEDDVVNYVWNFGDGNTISGNTLTYENYNTTHNYTIGGEKEIILSATSRNNDKDSRKILVIDTTATIKYAFTNIKEPENNENFAGGLVPFNASGSHGILFNSTEQTITCLIGDCFEYDMDGNLIDDVHKGYDGMRFNWTFDDTTYFNTKDEEGVSFTFYFPPGQHKAELIVEFDDPVVSEPETTNFITSGSGSLSCSLDGENWVLQDGSTISTLNNCYNESVSSGPNKCCPKGIECIYNSGTWKCEKTNVEFCFDYSTKEECENYTYGIAENTIEEILLKPQGINIGCGNFWIDDAGCIRYIDNCRCIWNYANGKCYGKYDEDRYCNTLENNGNCTIKKINVTDCNSEGWRYVKVQVEWEGTKPEYCNNIDKPVRCVDTTILPFFNSFSIILLFISSYFYYKKQSS